MTLEKLYRSPPRRGEAPEGAGVGDRGDEDPRGAPADARLPRHAGRDRRASSVPASGSTLVEHWRRGESHLPPTLPASTGHVASRRAAPGNELRPGAPAGSLAPHCTASGLARRGPGDLDYATRRTRAETPLLCPRRGIHGWVVTHAPRPPGAARAGEQSARPLGGLPAGAGAPLAGGS